MNMDEPVSKNQFTLLITNIVNKHFSDEVFAFEKDGASYIDQVVKLQFGHGVEAVETNDAEDARSKEEVASIRPRR